ncbi:hypothetical protein IWW48_004440 [Coemansia sp. RSA 1200]|nr:hypothetical protein IWW48_004440 [Coemansia sp. RSA 1200]
MPPIRIVVAGGNYAGLNAVRHLYATLIAPPSPSGSPQTAETTNTAAAAAAAAAAVGNQVEEDRNSSDNAVEITLIDKRDGFLHYIGITRGFTEPEFGEELWVPYATVPWLQHPCIKIQHATVTRITPNEVHLATSVVVPFDYLVIALGETRAAPIGTDALTKDQFVATLGAVHRQIRQARTVAVVGAGAVGIEMAADIKCDFQDKHVILAHSRALPLPGPFKDEFRRQVVGILETIGVDVMLGQRVIEQAPSASADGNVITPAPAPAPAPTTGGSDEEGGGGGGGGGGSGYTLTLADGRRVAADCVIRCLGAELDSTMGLLDLPVDSSDSTGPILGPSGIRVRDTMQVDSDRYPNIYACGDICSRDKVKLAGVAMYGGYIAARNIARSVLVQKNGKPEDESAEVGLEKGTLYPPKILLLLGKDEFAMQLDQEIWEKERVRPFVYDDMGLKVSVEGLSLTQTPEHDGDLGISTD